MGIAICLPEEDICPIQRALSRSNKRRGVIDTTLCDEDVIDLRQVGGFSGYFGFLHQ
jgi:hypothetical protein